jgi:branched-chain amino acid transport system ATP-binding protein
MTGTNVFEVKNLSMRFGGLAALSDVSFSVEPGQVFSIIGPNGAGKTTLFNCISGLYKPTSGSIRFNGEELVGKKPHEIARCGIARTFQNLELFANVTTLDNLMLGRHIFMKGGVWQNMFLSFERSRAAREEVAHRERVEQIIDLLELHSAREKRVQDLPYGVQKKVELGRALALDPKLLLLDEPSAGMTIEERENLMFWLGDVRAELGVSMLMIEHHMQMVMDISDEILAINFGTPMARGKPEEVAKDPAVIEAYLGAEEADVDTAVAE